MTLQEKAKNLLNELNKLNEDRVVDPSVPYGQPYISKEDDLESINTRVVRIPCPLPYEANRAFSFDLDIMYDIECSKEKVYGHPIGSFQMVRRIKWIDIDGDEHHCDLQGSFMDELQEALEEFNQTREINEFLSKFRVEDITVQHIGGESWFDSPYIK